MAKIPFTLDVWLKDKSQKVETRDGKHVATISVDMTRDDLRVCANFGNNRIVHYYDDGRFWKNANSDNDLFIVTPEEELTEFEKACVKLYNEGRDDGLSGDKLSNESVKESAAELLSLAREQLIKDGYVIEKKAFHDAVENISDKRRAEMSVEYSIHCKVEDGTRHAVMNWEAFQKVAQKFIDIGKAEALRIRATELTKNLVESGLDKDSIPYHLIEFMCNLYDCQNWKEIEETAEAYATRIKAVALKNLPRWKISLPEPGKRYVLLFNGGSIVESREYRRGNFYYEDGEHKNIEYNPKLVRWMYAEELYQLPGGFKED